MNPEIVALRPESTVDDAITFLRSASENTVTAALYVVDASSTGSSVSFDCAGSSPLVRRPFSVTSCPRM